jgi:hypothetical protein
MFARRDAVDQLILQRERGETLGLCRVVLGRHVFDNVVISGFSHNTIGRMSMQPQTKRIQQLAYAVKAMPGKRYLEHINSPQWAQRRRDHIESVGGWCEICGRRRACQVHHWYYGRLGHELPCDLCAICVQCHHKLHCSPVFVGGFLPANDNEPEFDFELPNIARSS